MFQQHFWGAKIHGVDDYMNTTVAAKKMSTLTTGGE